MTDLDFELHYQYMRFENECLKRRGSAFQSFFEAIMTKADPSFQTIKPWGKQGDEKCDGISPATGTFFQVYAPHDLTAAQTNAKIREDFSGANEHWSGQLKKWVFVWSGVPDGLPPSVAKTLHEIQSENPDVEIADWSPDALWGIVKELTVQQRAELLGPVPLAAAASRTTAAEVRTLLNWVADQPAGPGTLDEGFEQTDLADKVQLNELSDRVASLVGRSLPIVRDVERYVKNNVDGYFNGKVASRLVGEYERLAVREPTPDATFIGLVDFVAEGSDASQEEFWAAVGIVSHYFELCDIFKR